MSRLRTAFGGVTPDRHMAPVLTVVFLGVLVSALLAYFSTRHIVEGLALGQTTQTLGFIDREVSARIKEREFDLGLWSREDVFRLALEESYLGLSARGAGQSRLASRVADVREDRLFLIRPDGEIVIASLPGMVGSVNVSGRRYFERAMAGEPALETLPAGLDSGRPVLVAAAPVRGPGNAVLGVLAAAVDTERFAREILGDALLGSSGIAAILDASGRVLAASRPDGLGQAWPGSRMDKVRESVASGSIVTYQGDQAERMLVARVNIRTGWYLVIKADHDEVLRPAARLGWISGGVSAATLILAALALGALRRAMAGLRQSEEKFSKLFMLSPDGILLADPETLRIDDANETFCRMWGRWREDAIDNTIDSLEFFTDRAALEAFLETLRRDGRAANVEMEACARDRTMVACSLSGQLLEIGSRRHLMLIVRDVTEQRKMHEMMVQTEKMISVGGIAAGIAHEINNPLGIILQASQNLMQRTRADFRKNQEVAAEIGLDMELLRRYMQLRKLDVFLEDVQSAALRASSIIRHMLDFSRRSESRRAVCNIAEIMDRALDLAANDYDLRKSYDFKKISIVRDYAHDIPGIGCTATEIEQVLLNVLRNAAQALAVADPPSPRPRIEVRIRDLGDRVRIELGDNGPGMPENVKRRIFEPFYTTKPPGVGTGLGLSVSYFIVTKGHGGAMSVRTSPGGGAVFCIELPR